MKQAKQKVVPLPSLNACSGDLNAVQIETVKFY